MMSVEKELRSWPTRIGNAVRWPTLVPFMQGSGHHPARDIIVTSAS